MAQLSLEPSPYKDPGAYSSNETTGIYFSFLFQKALRFSNVQLQW